MPKSRGRSGKGRKSGSDRPERKRTRPLTLVEGTPDEPGPPPGSDDHPPSGPVLDAAIDGLRADLAEGRDETLPILAEASIARFVAMVKDRTLDADAPPDAIAEMERHFWADAGRDLAGRRDVDSYLLLAGLSRMVGPAGRLPLQKAFQTRIRTQHSAPDWADRIGGFRLTGALVTEDDTGDGLNVVLDFDDPRHAHTLVVFVDYNLGGLAKDVFVGPPVSLLVETYLDVEGIEVRAVDPEEALGMILQAMAETMRREDPPTSEDFEYFATLLFSRLADLDLIAVPPPLPPETPQSERAALVAEFTASRFAAGLPPAAGQIARLWLDHAVDQTIGGPLRVSSVLVELFFADWLPRAPVRVDLGAAPAVVKGWLRFAGARTGLASSTVREALEAVDVWAPTARSRGSILAEVGPASTAAGLSAHDLEQAYLSLPGLGTPPIPDLTGLDERTADLLGTIAPYAWMYAGDTMGTSFAAEAFDRAHQLAREAPDLIAQGQPLTWARAIAWMMAHEHDLIGLDDIPGPTGFAAELGSSVPTMRKKAEQIREALAGP